MAVKAVDDLAPFAVAIVSLVVIVAVGSVVLSEMTPQAYDTLTVDNETFSAGTDPYNHTVTKASTDTDFVDLESATAYDTVSQSTEVTTKIFGDDTVQVSGHTTTSDVSLDYSYNAESEASGVLGTGVSALQTFADFFTVLVVIGIAAVIFMLLSVLRSAGGRAAV